MLLLQLLCRVYSTVIAGIWLLLIIIWVIKYGFHKCKTFRIALCLFLTAWLLWFIVGVYGYISRQFGEEKKRINDYWYVCADLHMWCNECSYNPIWRYYTCRDHWCGIHGTSRYECFDVITKEKCLEKYKDSFFKNIRCNINKPSRLSWDLREYIDDSEYSYKQVCKNSDYGVSILEKNYDSYLGLNNEYYYYNENLYGPYMHNYAFYPYKEQTENRIELIPNVDNIPDSECEYYALVYWWEGITESIEYFEDGKVKEKWFNKDWEKVWPRIYYYENRNIKEKWSYKNWKKEWERDEYYENGLIKNEEYYKDWSRQSGWTSYSYEDDRLKLHGYIK